MKINKTEFAEISLCLILTDEAIVSFRKKIFSWFKTHKRDLPWRKNPDPYCVFLSEFMLQQTQVSRVIPYYTQFLKQYPDITKLARARQSSIVKLWSGLGYNRRALFLHKSAQKIVHEWNGEIPHKKELLLTLPGIGDYTASAILSFAFNVKTAVIDTNIRRVLIYELGLPEDIDSNLLREIALRCVPAGRSREYHSALMDYGALHATARKTAIKPLSFQSKFKGSFREIRGAVIKLLKQQALRLDELSAFIPDPRLPDALSQLCSETLIKLKGGIYFL